MKNFLTTFLAAIIVITAISFIPAKREAAFGKNTSTLPDEIKSIAEKSCMGCHSDDSKGISKSKLNFSKWDSYDAKKQASKAQAICKAITKGKMPPKKTRESKPEIIPTQAELDLICKWAQSFKGK